MKIISLLIAALSAGALATGALAAGPNFGTHKFEDYPAKVYTGPLAMPDFRHQREYRYYRTRLTQDSRSGVNFGGHYSMVVIGCGTGCASFYLVDLKNGRILLLPFGGERDELWGGDVLEAASIDMRRDSRLLKVSWLDVLDNDQHVCQHQEFVLENGKFRSLWHEQTKGECEE